MFICTFSPFANFTSLQVEEHIAIKTDLVLQFVSHCDTNSKRELYINELKKYINVSQYGKCAHRTLRKKSEAEEMLIGHTIHYILRRMVSDVLSDFRIRSTRPAKEYRFRRTYKTESLG